MLHGRGVHPDWPDVAGPLRTELPEHGWETLSLQMPVLGKSAKYDDYVPIFPAAFPRIRAGIEYLRARGADPVVIAAHSCSAHMAMAFVRHHGDAEFDGFISIGMGATDVGQPMREPFPLDAMSAPVLDLFGDEDYPSVPGKAPERLAAIRVAGNPRSAQRVVPGADHFFAGHGRGARHRGRGVARDPERRRVSTTPAPGRAPSGRTREACRGAVRSRPDTDVRHRAVARTRRGHAGSGCIGGHFGFWLA